MNCGVDMPYDGRILAQVRKAIAEEKAGNEAELEHRRAEVFEKSPELKSIDARIARLMTGVITGALRTRSDARAAVESTRGEVESLLSQKRRELTALGYPQDYLDETFTCSKCRDTGYILGKPCACLETRYKAESARELSSMLDTQGQCFETFRLDKYSDGFIPELGKSPRAIMSEVYELCREYAHSFGPDSPSLLFRGGTGLGKTFLSASIAKVVSDGGFSVVYDTAVSVFYSFESQKFDRAGENSEKINSRVRRYMGCDLLILDDLGTEMTTSFTTSALYTIINSRLLSGKKTIISTNLTPDEMSRRYTPQIVSRLEGCYMRLAFFGSDLRFSK